MEHQDWKPVVLRKTPAPEPHRPIGVESVRVENRQSGTSVNLLKLDKGDEDYVVPTITREIGLQISQARTKLGLSQDQLAKRCQIPVAYVKEYEQGCGIYNRVFLDPICKVLKIKISNPKTKAKASSS